MSNQDLVILTSTYGQSLKLASIDKRVLAFLSERGRLVINLGLLKKQSFSQVYEQTLGFLKKEPTIIAIVDQPKVLSLVLITAGIMNHCRTIVFCNNLLYPEFKAITASTLHVYAYRSHKDIINALKLLAL